MTFSPDDREIFQTLNRLVEKGLIESYALGGGSAVAFYAKPISTIDMDMFVFIADTSPLVSLAPIYHELTELGYPSEGPYVLIGDTPIQILVPPSEMEAEAIREAETHYYDDTPGRVFAAEYLVAVALNLYRPKDRERIDVLLKSGKVNQQKLAQLIQQYSLQGKWTRFERENSSS